MKRCQACGAIWEERHDPGKSETCLKCGADLHSCRNCRFFDTLKARQCASMTADPPTDKESANSCDEFQLADRPAPARSSQDRRQELEDKWKNLFKDER